MRLITSWNTSCASERVAFTFGAFDGIHLGHQHLFAELKKIAQEKGLKTAVLAFTHHPQETLMSGKKVPRITSGPMRRKLLEKIGIDFFLELPFTAEIANLEAEEFVSAVLSIVSVQVWLAGEDVAFGKARRGNKEVLEILAMKRAFFAQFLSKKRIDGQEVSSSRIRKLIREGELVQASKLLGRSFTLVAERMEGLHVPQHVEASVIHLDVSGLCVPKEGVWTATVRPWDSVHSQWFHAKLYLKRVPALIGEKEMYAEVYLEEQELIIQCTGSSFLEIKPEKYLRKA